MSTYVMPNSLFDSTPWNPVAVICRKMCLFLVLGKPEAAERLRLLELPQALAEAGWTDKDDAFLNLYHAEEVRAGEAAALAELLMPILTMGHRPREIRVAVPLPFA